MKIHKMKPKREIWAVKNKLKQKCLLKGNESKTTTWEFALIFYFIFSVLFLHFFPQTNKKGILVLLIVVPKLALMSLLEYLHA